ncbi:hypothetical protein DEU37_1947 [Microbacterium sp. AG790]|nr:hypothetical protein DEU37_1947 [Microbacterium sp. AG790]
MIVGTIGAQLVAVGGLAAGTTLIILGFSAESLFGFVPAALSSVALVVSAVRGNRGD